MNQTRKVAYNTIFQIIGKVIVTATSLVTIGYLTRYLGVAGYGMYTTIFAFVSFWGVLADFGFFWVLVRELAKPDTDKNSVFNNIITLKIIFGLVVFSACILAGFLIPQYSWNLKIGIAIISASWFWMSLNSTYVGLFQSQLEMYKASISEVIGRFIILGGVVWFVVIGADFQAVLSVYIIANFINFFINYLWGSKYIKFRPRFNFPLWRIVLIDSFPLALLSAIGIIHFKIDTVILSIIKGPVDVGIYGIPYKVLETITVIPGIFIGNIFPILTSYFHAKDNRLDSAIQKAFDFMVMLAVPIVIGLMVLSRPIINLIGGEDYLITSTVSVYGHAIAAPQVLMILGLAVGVTFLPMVFSGILIVTNKQKSQIVPMIVITAINIALNLIFIPRYSYFASAIITVFTETIVLIWWFFLSRKYLHFRLKYGVLPKALLAGLIMGLVVYFFKSLDVLLAAVVGIVVYFLAGYAVKLYDKDMIKQFIPFGGKDGE